MKKLTMLALSIAFMSSASFAGVIKKVNCLKDKNANITSIYIKLVHHDLYFDQYDIGVSSRSDNDSTPFGAVAIANSNGIISNECSAQMKGFQVDPVTGNLYGINKRSKTLLAMPKYALIAPQSMNGTFGEFYEYELVPGIELTSAIFEYKRKRELVIISELLLTDEGVTINKFDYKNIKLGFKNVLTGKTLRYESFKIKR